MPDFTFKKEEKLKSHILIEQMFQRKGQSFGLFPLRLIYLEMENTKNEFPIQFTLSVPKRAFSKAVDRNRIRRMIRETWRLNKHRLYEKLEDENRHFAFMVLYTAKEPFEYDKIEEAMKRMIKRFIKKELGRD
ncbi:ribonuclease P protein component [Saprospiraceae bacterium]|jgi:ribonuclease P protein component|nr:ribonuclease P protein component [Bacteroidota bacterium]MDB4727510.1 ribonuclease P protein component [Saprospiraceae bacterium]MDF1866983.1 ribonuclease P protein component [Saprospiraceae bacterium]